MYKYKTSLKYHYNTSHKNEYSELKQSINQKDSLQENIISKGLEQGKEEMFQTLNHKTIIGKRGRPQKHDNPLTKRSRRKMSELREKMIQNEGELQEADEEERLEDLEGDKNLNTSEKETAEIDMMLTVPTSANTFTLLEEDCTSCLAPKHQEVEL